MRRIFLIVFQSLGAIVAFGMAASAFAASFDPERIGPGIWLGRLRALFFFLAGLLLTWHAFRHTLRIGPAYPKDKGL